MSTCEATSLPCQAMKTYAYHFLRLLTYTNTTHNSSCSPS